MKVALIGYGSMATALGRRWAGAHELLVAGRDPARAAELAAALGHGARSGTLPEAAGFAEVLLLATPHEAVFDALDACGGAAALAGKALIDVNNPVVDFRGGDFLTRSYDGRSLAEAIAAHAPGAHVVKAFNMCQARIWEMAPPVFDGRRLVTLYCGDDPGAKRRSPG